MKKVIGIAVGGMAGAVLRYWIRSLDMNGLPWDTLIVNVTGSLLLAFLLTLALEKTRLSVELQSGLTVGFLGAFTTFSAICQEYVTFFSSGQTLLAVLYMAATVALGIAATFAGWRLARRLFSRDDAIPSDEEDID